jgi:hypothetical protein
LGFLFSSSLIGKAMIEVAGARTSRPTTFKHSANVGDERRVRGQGRRQHGRLLQLLEDAGVPAHRRHGVFPGLQAQLELVQRAAHGGLLPAEGTNEVHTEIWLLRLSYMQKRTVLHGFY